jgi:hypothetical protein
MSRYGEERAWVQTRGFPYSALAPEARDGYRLAPTFL